MATNNATNTSNPITVAQGGTGAATLTGILTGNGTSAITANAVSQYNLVVAGASNAASGIAPSATSGVPLISKGSSANPAYGTGFTINSSGYTNNANQPCFSAYLHTSVTNVTGDGTAYQIIFDTVLFDQASSYNSSTGVFTAPVAGIYAFNVAGLATGVLGTHNTLQFQIIPSSPAVNLQGSYINPYTVAANGGYCGVNTPFIVQLAASATVHFIFQVSGGTKVVGLDGGNTGSSNQIFTWCAGYLIC